MSFLQGLKIRGIGLITGPNQKYGGQDSHYERKAEFPDVFLRHRHESIP